MHILLIEPTTICGFDVVEDMVNADIEVSVIVQNLAHNMKYQDPAKMSLASRIIEVPELGNFLDVSKIIQEKIGTQKIDGVICREENFLNDAAHLTQFFNLPGETVQTANLIMNKAMVRNYLTNAKLGLLKWQLVHSLDEAVIAGKTIGYPLIIKPIFGGGSLNVKIVANEYILKQILLENTVIDNFKNGILLEEFVRGKIVSAEVLVQNGQPFLLGFSERLESPIGITAEIGGHFPAEFNFFEKTKDFVNGVINILGIRNSALHIEIAITSHGPELIEVNGRIAGYIVMQQISHALSRNITMDLISIATGKPLSPIGLPTCTVAIQSLWCDHECTVVDILPVESISKNIIMSNLLVEKGNTIFPLRSNSDRFGYAMAINKDKYSATNDVTNAIQSLYKRIIVASNTRKQLYNIVDPSLSIKKAMLNKNRSHVLILDRVGLDSFTLSNGTPLLPKEFFEVDIISSNVKLADCSYEEQNSIVKADVFDYASVVKIADEINNCSPIKFVSTVSERLLIHAANLRSRYNIFGDSQAIVNRFIDKAIMKQIAQKTGIKHAIGKVLQNSKELIRFLDYHEKIIVKPRISSGSQGMLIINNEFIAKKWLKEHFISDKFVVEKFIEGQVCHIDALVWHGSILAWNVALYLSDTTSFRHNKPLSSIVVEDKQIRNSAENLLFQVINAWEVNSAVLHLEAFVTQDDLIFCEVAGRPGGAGAVQEFEITRGINLEHAKILIDCDEDPRKLQRDPIANYAGVTIHYCKGGILEFFDDSLIKNDTYYRWLAAVPGQVVPMSMFTGSGISTHVFACNIHKDVLDLISKAESSIYFKVQ